MNKLLRFIRDVIWPTFQFILAVSITVLVLSVIPVFIILLTGFVGLAFATQISFMVILNSPFYGSAIAILIFAGVIAATVIAIALLILVLILTVSFTVLPISLIVQTILRRKETKSWLMHITIYSFSGALTGIVLGSLVLLITWANLQESQYSALAMFSVMTVSILSGILSVNICGITLVTTEKVRDFFLATLSRKRSKLMLSQGVL
jgi:hypothetical protein